MINNNNLLKSFLPKNVDNNNQSEMNSILSIKNPKTGKEELINKETGEKINIEKIVNPKTGKSELINKDTGEKIKNIQIKKDPNTGEEIYCPIHKNEKNIINNNLTDNNDIIIKRDSKTGKEIHINKITNNKQIEYNRKKDSQESKKKKMKSKIKLFDSLPDFSNSNLDNIEKIKILKERMFTDSNENNERNILTNQYYTSRIKTKLNRDNNELFFKIIRQSQHSNVQNYNDLPYESMLSSIRILMDNNNNSKSPGKKNPPNPDSQVSKILNSINLHYNSRTIEDEEDSDINNNNKSVNNDFKKREHSLNLKPKTMKNGYITNFNSFIHKVNDIDNNVYSSQDNYFNILSYKNKATEISNKKNKKKVKNGDFRSSNKGNLMSEKNNKKNKNNEIKLSINSNNLNNENIKNLKSGYIENCRVHIYKNKNMINKELTPKVPIKFSQSIFDQNNNNFNNIKNHKNYYPNYSQIIQSNFDKIDKGKSPLRRFNESNLPDISSISQLSDNFYKLPDSKINNIMLPNAMDSERYKFFKK